MKKIITISLLLFIVGYSYSQEKKIEQSKMHEFTSKTGVILKFEDYELPNIKLSYGIAESKIRKIIAGNQVQYFFQISKKGKYDTKTASIAYEDLLELQKAISNLKNQSINDVITNSDYLENKFITEDGFQVGYYVSKTKIVWYMKLERYGSDNTAFVKDYQTIEEAFKLGKEKIEELKK